MEEVHPKHKRGPNEPTQKERDDHEQEGCVNFRSWCMWCQASHGVHQPHQRRDAEEVAVETPTIHMDFYYMDDRNIGSSARRAAPEELVTEEVHP